MHGRSRRKKNTEFKEERKESASSKLFDCPISQETIVDAVISPSGISYNREDLTIWVNLNGRDPQHPAIRLSVKSFIPNSALNAVIAEHKQLTAHKTLSDTYEPKLDSMTDTLQAALAQLDKKPLPRHFDTCHWPSMLCPYSLEFFTDPVTTPSGITYEKSAITVWLEKHSFDPLTGKSLTKKDLFPNLALKDAIPLFKPKWQPNAELRKKVSTLKQLTTRYSQEITKSVKMQQQTRIKHYVFVGAAITCAATYVWRCASSPSSAPSTTGSMSTALTLPTAGVCAPLMITKEILQPLMTGAREVVASYFSAAFDHFYTFNDYNACATQQEQSSCIKAFKFAVTHKRIEMLQDLLKSLTPKSLSEIADKALAEDDAITMSLLNSAEPGIILRDKSAIITAAKMGANNIMKLLLELGVPIDISVGGQTALLAAIKSASETAVTFLLKNKAKLTLDHLEVLMNASLDYILKIIIKLRPKMLKKLLQTTPVKIQSPDTPAQFVKLLLDAGAPLNGIENNCLLLGSAMETRAHEAVAFLIKEGAKIPNVVLQGSVNNFVKTMGSLIANGFEILSKDSWKISELDYRDIIIIMMDEIKWFGSSIQNKEASQKGIEALFKYGLENHFSHPIKLFKAHSILSPQRIKELEDAYQNSHRVYHLPGLTVFASPGAKVSLETPSAQSSPSLLSGAP